MSDLDPGVPAPPAEPVVSATPAPSEPAQPVAPIGSEPVTNSGQPTTEQTVPFDRFQEVNDRAKKAEEELQQLRDQQPAPVTPNAEDDLDPDVEATIRLAAKKLGLVSQDELAAERNRVQVQQDINDLTATPPVAGIPYDNKAVMDYAKANNLPITSKSALQAAYTQLNLSKIMEAERNRAIDSYKAGGNGAEQPSSPGPQAPSDPEVTGRNPKERTMSRIQQARQRITS